MSPLFRSFSSMSDITGKRKVGWGGFLGASQPSLGLGLDPPSSLGHPPHSPSQTGRPCRVGHPEPRLPPLPAIHFLPSSLLFQEAEGWPGGMCGGVTHPRFTPLEGTQFLFSWTLTLPCISHTHLNPHFLSPGSVTLKPWSPGLSSSSSSDSVWPLGKPDLLGRYHGCRERSWV